MFIKYAFLTVHILVTTVTMYAKNVSHWPNQQNLVLKYFANAEKINKN